MSAVMIPSIIAPIVTPAMINGDELIVPEALLVVILTDSIDEVGMKVRVDATEGAVEGILGAMDGSVEG